MIAMLLSSTSRRKVLMTMTWAISNPKSESLVKSRVLRSSPKSAKRVKIVTTTW